MPLPSPIRTGNDVTRPSTATGARLVPSDGAPSPAAPPPRHATVWIADGDCTTDYTTHYNKHVSHSQYVVLRQICPMCSNMLYYSVRSVPVSVTVTETVAMTVGRWRPPPPPPRPVRCRPALSVRSVGVGGPAGQSAGGVSRGGRPPEPPMGLRRNQNRLRIRVLDCVRERGAGEWSPAAVVVRPS